MFSRLRCSHGSQWRSVCAGMLIVVGIVSFHSGAPCTIRIVSDCFADGAVKNVTQLVPPNVLGTHVVLGIGAQHGM